MKDVAPELKEALQKAFRENLQGNTVADSLRAALETGKGDYATAGRYAQEVGKSLREAMASTISSEVLPDGKLYWNIAKGAIEPVFQEAGLDASAAAELAQKAINEEAGIGLNPVKYRPSEKDYSGILNKAVESANYDSVKKLIEEAASTMPRRVVDRSLRENAEFQGKAGLTAKVIRRATRDACPWCRSIAGEYIYPDVPNDVYRRHSNCTCSCNYKPSKFERSDGKKQNIWGKQWTTEENDDIVKKNSGTKLEDIIIGKSLGAKSKNYTVMDLATGEFYEFVEGSRIQDQEVFAGLGSKKRYEKAYKYAEKYGGAPEEWQHVKGHGILSTEDGYRKAEVHWSQHKKYGKHDFFVKRWDDE